MQWLEPAALDSSANLEDALAQRLRRGLRIGAIIALPIFVGLVIAELFVGVEVSWFLNLARVLVAGGAAALGFSLPAHASHRRVVLSAIVLHSLAIGYTLVRIAITGGAASPEIALFAIAMAAATFLMPINPRYSVPLYIGFYIASAFVCQLCSPPGTTASTMLNMHKITFISLGLSVLGAWLHHRALREMFEWRLALREESRRAALALERARIARDLHDHVGARLTGIALRAEREQKKAPRSKHATR